VLNGGNASAQNIGAALTRRRDRRIAAKR